MKLIEAMKQIKLNDEKLADLHKKLTQYAAHTSLEVPEYGSDTQKKIDGWLQSCADINQESVRLLCALQLTNLKTAVTIELGGKSVKKSIAAWVWRRRKYAEFDRLTWAALSGRNVKEGHVQLSPGTEPVQITVVRYYDPSDRDERLAIYHEEPHRIDTALEIVNATTDLIE